MTGIMSAPIPPDSRFGLQLAERRPFRLHMAKSLGLVALTVLAMAGCKKSEASTSRDAGVAPAAPSVIAGPVVAEEDPYDQIVKLTSFADALEYAHPRMVDKFGADDRGSVMLAHWSAAHMRWSDVAVAKNEISHAMVMKDPDEARGKRLCFSGSVVQIAVERIVTGKAHAGLLRDYSRRLYRFYASGSSGDLVESSQMRFCGVVTGKYDYPNSGGGTGHAIKVVGMFDLPVNRAQR